MLFSCAAMAAQEKPNSMVVRQRDGNVHRFSFSCIDYLDFPEVVKVSEFGDITTEALTVHMSSTATVPQFVVEEVERVNFAVEESPVPGSAVDLGLSVLWATCNVGASRPEEYGGFYAWGETTAKGSFTEQNYAFYQNQQYTYIGVNICGTKYDVARQTWGGDWRLPTRSEIRELTTRCKWTAETLNGIKGYRVTGDNGNSIFLPAAGYQNGTTPSEVGVGGFYWSGSLDRSMPSAAYNLNFRGYDADWSASRAYGFSVRPVK